MLIALLVRPAGSDPRGSTTSRPGSRLARALHCWSPVLRSPDGLRSQPRSRSSPPGPSHGSSSTMLPPAISPASHEDRTRLASQSNLILSNLKMHFTNQIASFLRVLCFCKCKKMQGFGPPDKSRLWSPTCSTSEWSQNYSRYPGHTIYFYKFLDLRESPNFEYRCRKIRKNFPRSFPVLVFTFLFPSKLRLHNSCLIFVVRTFVIRPLLLFYKVTKINIFLVLDCFV